MTVQVPEVPACAGMTVWMPEDGVDAGMMVKGQRGLGGDYVEHWQPHYFYQ